VGKKLPLASKEFHRKKAGRMECWNNGMLGSKEVRSQEPGDRRKNGMMGTKGDRSQESEDRRKGRNIGILGKQEDPSGIEKQRPQLNKEAAAFNGVNIPPR
jgi:hypothetical protein